MAIKNKIIQTIKRLGEPNGISTLDENGKVLKEQLPDGIGSKLVTINKYIDLKEDTNTIELGIEEFNSKEDMLKVHLNGDLLSKDYNYKITDDGLHIENLSEIIKWQQGDIFDIEVCKNVSTEKPDKIDVTLIENGSITENKLDSGFVKTVTDNKNSIDVLNNSVNTLDEKIKNLGNQNSEELKQLIDYIEVENTHQNMNIMDMAIELEVLKNAELNNLNTNICIENFKNIDDVIVSNGGYSAEKQRIELSDNTWIKCIGFCYE